MFEDMKNDLKMLGSKIRKSKKLINGPGSKEVIAMKQFMLWKNKDAARHLHIAYCELKGRAFSTIENRCKTEPCRARIEQLKVHYLKRMVKKLVDSDITQYSPNTLFDPIPKRMKPRLNHIEHVDLAVKKIKKAQKHLTNLKRGYTLSQKKQEVKA